MPRSSWLNLLIILLVIIAASYVAQVLIDFLSRFSDIILIVVLSWLVAYALSPLVEALNNRPFPAAVATVVGRMTLRRSESWLAAFRVSRVVAVALVYMSLALVVVVIIAALIPATVEQLNAVGPQLTNFDLLMTTLAVSIQSILQRFNLNIDIDLFMENAITGLNSLATPILENTVTILTGFLSLLGNALLVVLLSFFFALDGPRFTKMVFDAMPERLHQETRMFIITTDRAFGGFLRAQLAQAAAVGVFTGLLMAALGIQGALVSALFAGLFMLIPLIGPLLSIIPPLLATLLTSADQIWVVLLPLIIFQLLLTNVVMPRLVGGALGLHPLVIILALLVGIKIAGFWGAFFAMPLAGIISAFGSFLIRRRERLQELTSAIVQTDEPLAPTVADSIAEDYVQPEASSTVQKIAKET